MSRFAALALALLCPVAAQATPKATCAEIPLASADTFLGESFGAGLRFARYRNRPAVIDHAQNQRQLIGAAGIDRGIEIGLG